MHSTGLGRLEISVDVGQNRVSCGQASECENVVQSSTTNGKDTRGHTKDCHRILTFEPLSKSLVGMHPHEFARHVDSSPYYDEALR